MIVTAAALAVLACAGALAALGPDDYRKRQRDVALPAEEAARATVLCPVRHRVLAGGAFVHGAGERGPDAETALNAAVPSSFPVRRVARWTAVGYKGPGDDLRLRAVAYCLPKNRLRGQTVVRKEFEIGSGEAGGGTAECPPRERLFTGGVRWHQSGSASSVSEMVRTSSSIPIGGGRAWYGDGHNFTVGVLHLDVVAVCLPKRRVGGITRVSKDVLYPAYSEPFGRTVRCPAGKRVLTGGASWHPAGERPVPEDAFGTQVSSSAPIANARKWYADGVNFIGPADARLRIAALCVAE